jgi:hypothetical protein
MRGIVTSKSLPFLFCFKKVVFPLGQGNSTAEKPFQAERRVDAIEKYYDYQESVGIAA